MPSRILPMEEIEQLGPNYFLPPGGQDNGVAATSWAVIAELDTHEVSLVLSELADAGVGAYAAGSSGLTPRANAPGRRLYVDAMQYGRAVDALMLFLRGKESRDLGGYIPTKRAATPVAAPQRSATVRIAITAAKGLLGAALLALLLALGYQAFVDQYPGLVGGHHGQDPPGIHQPTVPPTP